MRLAVVYACTTAALAFTMISSVAYRSHRALSTRILTSSLLSSVRSNANAKLCTSSNSTRSKDLHAVREQLNKQGIDALIVPTDDPHMSEYTADCFGRREFISGFTGSAGTAVITASAAALFTDGRYFSQAISELDHNWTLMRIGEVGVPSVIEYLCDVLPGGATIGVDERVHSAEAYRIMQRDLLSRNISIKHLESNPIDSVWGSRRPSLPTGKVRQHPLIYAGHSTSEKLQQVRHKLYQQRAFALIVTMLDEIAWLFNIRGCDVMCNPVTLSYAFISDSKPGHYFQNVYSYILPDLTQFWLLFRKSSVIY